MEAAYSEQYLAYIHAHFPPPNEYAINSTIVNGNPPKKETGEPE